MEDLVQLCTAHREPLLASHLVQDVRMVRLDAPELVLQMTDHAPRDLHRTLQEKLSTWTGQSWRVHVMSQDIAQEQDIAPAPTLESQRADRVATRAAVALATPLATPLQTNAL